jgi:hypothetical protein
MGPNLPKVLKRLALNVLTALPSLSLAAAYVIVTPHGGQFLGMDGDYLADLIGVELLVILLFPVIWFLALMDKAHPASAGNHLGLLLGWGYLLLIGGSGTWLIGIRFFLFFVWAVLATFLGFWMNQENRSLMLRISAQCVITFFLYTGLMLRFGPTGFSDFTAARAGIFLVGRYYFLVLGILDLSGFYYFPFWVRLSRK